MLNNSASGGSSPDWVVAEKRISKLMMSASMMMMRMVMIMMIRLEWSGVVFHKLESGILVALLFGYMPNRVFRTCILFYFWTMEGTWVLSSSDNYKFNHDIEFPGNPCCPNASTLHLLKLSFGLPLICYAQTKRKKKTQLPPICVYVSSLPFADFGWIDCLMWLPSSSSLLQL